MVLPTVRIKFAWFSWKSATLLNERVRRASRGRRTRNSNYWPHWRQARCRHAADPRGIFILSVFLSTNLLQVYMPVQNLTGYYVAPPLVAKRITISGAEFIEGAMRPCLPVLALCPLQCFYGCIG